MKKFVLGLLVQIVFVTSGAFAASSVADLSSGPAKPGAVESEEVSVEVPNTENDTIQRRVKSGANLYYSDENISDTGQRFGNCTEDGCDNTPRSVRSEIRRASDERKYHIASPFFQPQESQFTSVTDVSYRSNSLGFYVLPGTGFFQDNTGTYKYSGLSFSENLSFGITDDLTVIGALQYTSASLEFNWDTIAPPNDKDKNEDNKVDMYGIGLQWRFINDKDWIGTILGSYQQLVDAANVMTIDAKLGYKVGDSSIYGFGRGYVLNWNDTGYGFGVVSDSGQAYAFMLDEDAKVSFYYDLGIGLFSAISNNWSTDLNVAYSYGEWHSQIYGRAAISYQPGKNTSISFYGRFVAKDTANGFDKSTIVLMNNVPQPLLLGTAKFSNYSDITVGIQLGLVF